MAESSSSIKRAIAFTQEGINKYKDIILELEALLEKQEAAYINFNSDISNFEDDIINKRTRISSIAGIMLKSTLAKGYAGKMDIEFSNDSWLQQRNNIIDAQESLQAEITATKDKLKEAREVLATLESNLRSLEYQYQSALRREAEELAALLSAPSSTARRTTNG